jgi:serine protease Do
MFVRAKFAALSALLMAAASQAQEPAKSGAQEDKDPFRVHIRMHKKVAPKIVHVRGGSQTGTGVIIRSDGLILTSPTACGAGSSEATVILQGNRRVNAKVVGRRIDLELALLKIDAKDLPVMEFADSTKARVGQIAYAFGDVWESIAIDDQVAMSLGIVSGLYEVSETQQNSLYTGPVIETSAAVNQNLDGGPLVDAEGKLLGIITLNYHPAKFTGIAVPAHILKPEIDRLIKEFTEGPVARVPGFVGITAGEKPGEWIGVRITNVVPGSPATKANPGPLLVGDEIVRIDEVRVTSFTRFEELTSNIRPATRIRFRVKRGDKETTITVTAGTRSQTKTEY